MSYNNWRLVEDNIVHNIQRFIDYRSDLVEPQEYLLMASCDFARSIVQALDLNESPVEVASITYTTIKELLH